MSFKKILLVLFVSAHVLENGMLNAAELHALVKDSDGKPVEDAVVVAMPLEAKNFAKNRVKNQIIDQIDKEFLPYVLPVYVNTQVFFPNKDNIRHQVYSFSPPKRFELPLYAGTPAAPVIFDKPGVVVLGCNIHDWMLGYVYVSDSPFFAKTSVDGKGVIEDLPAGEYDVRVWHPQLIAKEDSTVHRLRFSDTSQEKFEWQLTLKPSTRIPRTTKSRSVGYH